MNDEVIILESIVIPKKIRWNGIVWIPEQKGVEKINLKLKKPRKIVEKTDPNFTKPVGNVKKPYIVKWIEKKDVDDIFTKEEFYEIYPKLKKDCAGKKRVDEAIQDMILNGRIEQWEALGQYKVLKK